MAEASFRAFLAIELPEAPRRALMRLLEELRDRDPSSAVRWVRPDAVHLTLKFLGQTPESRVDAIREALAEVSSRQAPFPLRLGNLGSFPRGSTRSPRVLWLGIDGDMKALASTQQELESGLARRGFPRETRAFTPHLTLGRVTGERSAASSILAEVSWNPQDASAFMAEGVSLMESALHPGGARYVRRLFSPFAGKERSENR